jgi:hypothetical protein
MFFKLKMINEHKELIKDFLFGDSEYWKYQWKKVMYDVNSYISILVSEIPLNIIQAVKFKECIRLLKRYGEIKRLE